MSGLRLLRLSAAAGFNGALDSLKERYKVGFMANDDLEKSIRAYHEAQKEMKTLELPRGRLLRKRSTRWHC